MLILDFRESKKTRANAISFSFSNILLADDLDLKESCLEDSFEKNVELTLVISFQSVGKPIQLST